MKIAASSASYDLRSRLRVSERAGVPEYIVWRTEDRAVDWFMLRDGRYVRVEPDARGIMVSGTLPGLRLAVPALLAGDSAATIAGLGG
jgi:Uma2 family endonuclease